MTIGEAVRQRIVELCQERNISFNKLSSMSGVTQSTVNNIVSGRNNSATVSTIKKLCDGLGKFVLTFRCIGAFEIHNVVKVALGTFRYLKMHYFSSPLCSL